MCSPWSTDLSLHHRYLMVWWPSCGPWPGDQSIRPWKTTANNHPHCDNNKPFIHSFIHPSIHPSDDDNDNDDSMAALAGPAMAFPCDGTFVDSHARYHHHHDDHDDTNLDHQTDDDDAKDATSKSMLSFVSPVLQPVEQRARQLLLLRLLQQQEEEEEEQVAGVRVMVESKEAGAGKDAGAAAAFASIWDKLLRVMTARTSQTSTKMKMTLRDQLQALQSVQRCLRDRNHNRNNKKTPTTEDEEHAPDTTNTTAAAVYWLLLEAAIANATPTCLSRALFSTLETLWWFLSVPPHITATTTTTAENDSLPPPQQQQLKQRQLLQHIHRYVWESVCQVTTSTSTATTTTTTIPSESLSSSNDWKDPIRSLKLLITYPPMILPHGHTSTHQCSHSLECHEPYLRLDRTGGQTLKRIQQLLQ